MHCPYCNSKKTKVVDKRDNNDTNVTRRRRECEECEKRFTTYERIENVLIMVKKRNGATEEFDREKLKRGIMKAISKRDLPEDDVNEMIGKIERKILGSGRDRIDSVEIGKISLKELSKLDELGALLFAAVYKEFKSLEDVKKELDS